MATKFTPQRHIVAPWREIVAKSRLIAFDHMTTLVGERYFTMLDRDVLSVSTGRRIKSPQLSIYAKALGAGVEFIVAPDDQTKRGVAQITKEINTGVTLSNHSIQLFDAIWPGLVGDWRPIETYHSLRRQHSWGERVRQLRNNISAVNTAFRTRGLSPPTVPQERRSTCGINGGTLARGGSLYVAFNNTHSRGYPCRHLNSNAVAWIARVDLLDREAAMITKISATPTKYAEAFSSSFGGFTVKYDDDVEQFIPWAVNPSLIQSAPSLKVGDRVEVAYASKRKNSLWSDIF